MQVLVHFCTCGFWFVKVTSNSDEDIVAFGEAHGLDAPLPWQVRSGIDDRRDTRGG